MAERKTFKKYSRHQNVIVLSTSDISNCKSLQFDANFLTNILM